jgi:opacity protein-like surface antigen
MRHSSMWSHWFAAVFGISFVFSHPAVFAQDAPKAEIFAGYSYANYELLPAAPAFSNSNETISGNPSGRLGTNGWDASVAAKLTPWFSFVTDFSGYYSGSSVSITSTQTITNSCAPLSCPPFTSTIVNTAAKPKIYNFLFGPQFSFTTGKLKPFAHFLVGGAHSDVTRSVSVSSSGNIESLAEPPEAGTTGFALAIGGGVDYSLKPNLAWRVQADYLTGQGTGQNHVRVSTGPVWRPGH